MSSFDVHADGMDSRPSLPHLTDREVEGILYGRTPAGRLEVAPLVTVVDMLRSTGTGDAPRADATLAAVFTDGLPEDGPPAPLWAIPPEPEVPAQGNRRRTGWKAIRVMSTVLGTVVGKLLVTAAIAAASIGAAQVTGVIDVPGLPSRTPKVDTTKVQHGPSPEPSPTGERVRAPAGAAEDTRDRGGASERVPAAAGARGASEGTRTGAGGGAVSDRATSGEPKAGGSAFGRSVADDASAGNQAARSEDTDSAADGTVPPGQAKDENVPPGQAKDTNVPPGQAKDTNVPPGQAKDKNIPPGQAKKQDAAQGGDQE